MRGVGSTKLDSLLDEWNSLELLESGNLHYCVRSIGSTLLLLQCAKTIDC